MKSSLLFGTVAAVVCFAPGVFAERFIMKMALSPAEVEQRAKAVSVEMLTGEGSGVIIHRQGDLYTVIRLFPLKNLPNPKNSPPVEGCPEGGVVHHCTTPNSQYTH